MSSVNLLPPSVPPGEPLYPVLVAPSENSACKRSTRFPTLWIMRSATIASLLKNTNGQEIR